MVQKMEIPDDMIAVVCAIYKRCGYRASIHCHLPLEAVLSEFPPWLRGYYKKVLRKCVSKGLVYEKHHGKGRRSYGLTREGVRLALAYCGQH